MDQFKNIEDVKKGDYFKRKPDSKKVYVKDSFNRSIGKYEAHNFEDINEFMSFKKGTKVFIDFEF